MDAALKALAEPRRREIVRLVWSEELPATAIAARFSEVTRSAISQHLGILREAGLVHERKEGTRRLYRSNHHEMARLRAYLDDYWTTCYLRFRQIDCDNVCKISKYYWCLAGQELCARCKNIRNWDCFFS